LVRFEITDDNFSVAFAAHVRASMRRLRSNGATIPEYLKAYAQSIDEREEAVINVFYGDSKPTHKILKDMGLKAKFESWTVNSHKLRLMGLKAPDEYEVRRTRYIKVEECSGI